MEFEIKRDVDGEWSKKLRHKTNEKHYQEDRAEEQTRGVKATTRQTSLMRSRISSLSSWPEPSDDSKILRINSVVKVQRVVRVRFLLRCHDG